MVLVLLFAGLNRCRFSVGAFHRLLPARASSCTAAPTAGHSWLPRHYGVVLCVAIGARVSSRGEGSAATRDVVGATYLPSTRGLLFRCCLRSPSSRDRRDRWQPLPASGSSPCLVCEEDGADGKETMAFWFWFWFWLGCTPSTATAEFTLRDPSPPCNKIRKGERERGKE